MVDAEFDRERLKRVAEDTMSGDNRRYRSVPSRIHTPELVRCMRECEQAAYGSYCDRDSQVSRDFALGMWTAFAAIRYDFSIHDEGLVDTDGDP